MPEPDSDSIDIIIEAREWHDALKNPENISKTIVNAVVCEFDDTAKSVAILLCDDAKMQSLNFKFRGYDKPTNVLSFEGAPDSGHLGDIALGFETCAREAIEQGKTLINHFTHLLVHGVLHLLGYDHINDKDAEQMESLEKEILSKMDIDDPYLIIGEG